MQVTFRFHNAYQPFLGLQAASLTETAPLVLSFQRQPTMQNLGLTSLQRTASQHSLYPYHLSAIKIQVSLLYLFSQDIKQLEACPALP